MEEPRSIALLPFKERSLPAQQHALGAYQVPGALHTQEVGEVLTLQLRKQKRASQAALNRAHLVAPGRRAVENADERLRFAVPRELAGAPRRSPVLATALSRGIPRIGELHAQERGGFAPIASLLGEPSSGKSNMGVKQWVFLSQLALLCSRRLVRLGSAIFLAGWQ